MEGLFGCFLGKFHLAFPCLDVTSCLHLVGYPLYLYSWRCRCCRLGCSEWDAFLILSILDLAQRFHHQRMETAITHFRSTQWSSRSFDAVELTSTFFLIRNVTKCWFGNPRTSCYLSDGLILLFRLMMASVSCIDITLDCHTSIQYQELTPDLSPASFVLRWKGNWPQTPVNLLVGRLPKLFSALY